MSRETENARRVTKDNEAKILEHWELREKHQSELEQTKSDLESIRSQISEEKSGSDSSGNELDTKLETLRSGRSELSPDIKPSLLKRYDQVRQKRRGQGLAVVSGGTCQACHMMLPPQLYNTILRGESIETCPSCLRFLISENHIPQEIPAETNEESLEATTA